MNKENVIEVHELNRSVVEEFRENEGRVGHRFENLPLLLVTLAAESGEIREKPLAYLQDGDRYIVAASNLGADKHPPWYRNVLAYPEVGIEVGAKKFRARAVSAVEPERTELYDKLATAMPVFSEFQAKTKRVIPVVIFSRI